MTNRLNATIFVLLFAAIGCIHRSAGTLHDTPTEPLSESQILLRDEIHRDVRELSLDIGPRHATDSLEALLDAEAWIAGRLRSMGLEPSRDEIDLNGFATVANVEASLRGARYPDEIVVIGGHYDTVPGSPGANDNASGVALLLAAAARLSATPMDRTVRIVFFVNEESPFTGGHQMGSMVYADRCKARGDDIVAMIAVDSIGYYTSERGSQDYPLLAKPLMPSRGNFVAFVGDRDQRRYLDRVVSIFQEHSRFPSIGLAAGSGRTDRSDHASFLWRGYPAILFSDTSEVRDPSYHEPTDTPERLDYGSMARVAEGFIETVRSLASAETPHSGIAAR